VFESTPLSPKGLEFAEERARLMAKSRQMGATKTANERARLAAEQIAASAGPEISLQIGIDKRSAKVVIQVGIQGEGIERLVDNEGGVRMAFRYSQHEAAQLATTLIRACGLLDRDEEEGRVVLPPHVRRKEKRKVAVRNGKVVKLLG
jgi:hypothetical protein